MCRARERKVHMLTQLSVIADQLIGLDDLSVALKIGLQTAEQMCLRRFAGVHSPFQTSRLEDHL